MSSVIYNNWDPCQDGGNEAVPEGPPCKNGMAYDITYDTCYVVSKNSADEAWDTGKRKVGSLKDLQWQMC